MPFPLVALAYKLGAPDLGVAIAFAVGVNVAASLACVACLRYTIPEDYLPASLTAWPWEVSPFGWGSNLIAIIRFAV